MFSNCFWKYFIAETIVTASVCLACSNIPGWLIDIIAATFTVLYAIEALPNIIKEVKNDRDI